MSEPVSEKKFIRLQLSKEERDFILRTFKDYSLSAVLEKIQLAQQLPKLRTYVECYLTLDEFNSLELALRYEARNNRKKIISEAAKDIIDNLKGLKDSLKE